MHPKLGHRKHMEELSFTHDATLVAMACLVAVVSGFTGLSLTRDLSRKTVFDKKVSITLSSIALGGGIWAMHFIAMLGVQLPILYYYDAAITLISALTAILIVGGALILLHFQPRTPLVLTLAGGILGVGILVMHYIGMAGLELCRAVYTPLGVLVSSVLAIGFCVLAIWIAYGRRTNRNILLGTLCFAVAVCSVHFLAMAGTRFVALEGITEFGPKMSNETLALGVIFFSFVIFGTCLWVSVTYLVGSGEAEKVSAKRIAEAGSTQGDIPETTEALEDAAPTPAHQPLFQIPCERDGGKVFIAPTEVLFVRADGHYTQVYTGTERLFCAWPVTEARKRLGPEGFLQTHRSYLVNPAHVVRFERAKDKGLCRFEAENVPAVPVSRSKLGVIQDALVAQVGAIRAG